MSSSQLNYAGSSSLDASARTKFGDVASSDDTAGQQKVNKWIPRRPSTRERIWLDNAIWPAAARTHERLASTFNPKVAGSIPARPIEKDLATALRGAIACAAKGATVLTLETDPTQADARQKVRRGPRREMTPPSNRENELRRDSHEASPQGLGSGGERSADRLMGDSSDTHEQFRGRSPLVRLAGKGASRPNSSGRLSAWATGARTASGAARASGRRRWRTLSSTRSSAGGAASGSRRRRRGRPRADTPARRSAARRAGLPSRPRSPARRRSPPPTGPRGRGGRG